MEIEIVELLIHKELVGKISDKEQGMLAAWLEEKAEHKQTYEEVCTIWQLSKMEENALLPVDLDNGLSKLNTLIAKESPRTVKAAKVKAMPKKSFVLPWMKIAAGFILLLGIAMIGRVFSPSGERQFVETTQSGEVQTLDMADGSTILLNETSELVFFPHIKSERRVNLKGEAFFDVARDESKPFIIETSNASINVLGTSFNVDASENGLTKVTVRSGKVNVTPKNGEAPRILTKGQSILLGNAFETLETVDNVKLDNYKGLLTFNDTKMDKVFTNLNLIFGHRFLWNSDQLKDCELNGELDDKSLTEIMAILKTALEIEEITITEDLVTLVGGQCD